MTTAKNRHRTRRVIATIGALLPAVVGGSIATPTPAAARWQPTPGLDWQWQLSGLPVDTTVNVPVYDIDGFDNDARVVTTLHNAGRRAVCYLNAGAWENWRPDAASYPPELRGNPLHGWPGEQWLDIRRTDLLQPILANRFDMCRNKGFDAVEPDNMDNYANNSGFPLSYDDQLAFNRMVAQLAHDRGMAVALKNDLDQIPDLLPSFDFAVNEQCAQNNECAVLAPFIAAGKAVFQAEYNLDPARFCPDALAAGRSAIRKNLGLDAWRQGC